MKHLRATAGHPLLQAVLDKPVPFILPENSPEYVKPHCIAADRTPVAPIIQWELGLNPGKQTESAALPRSRAGHAHP